MANGTFRHIIKQKSSGRGRIIVSAGGQVFKGSVVDAAQLGEDYFVLDGLFLKDIPLGEGNGSVKLNVPYSAVDWWVDL